MSRTRAETHARVYHAKYVPEVAERAHWKVAKDFGTPMCGIHGFRCFRNTFLRNHTNCPDGIRKFWLGWSAEGMGERYDRVRDDLEFRREVAMSVGVGFELPKTLTPKPPCRTGPNAT